MRQSFVRSPSPLALLLVGVLTACDGAGGSAGDLVDAGATDAGETDAGETEVDAGNGDSDGHDAGEVDAGGPNVGEVDAGEPDAGEADAGEPDAGEVDASMPVDLCAGVTCTALDQCHGAGTCDPATGQCSTPVIADGTTCDDGDLCTQQDTCQGGLCVGDAPVACVAVDGCHEAGTCDPATGQCSTPVIADGVPCDDSDLCTQQDTCQSGLCVGEEPIVCTATDGCHVAGTCDPTSGQCSNPNAADGTSCEEGDFCTDQAACRSGTCQSPVTVSFETRWRNGAGNVVTRTVTTTPNKTACVGTLLDVDDDPAPDFEAQVTFADDRGPTLDVVPLGTLSGVGVIATISDPSHLFLARDGLQLGFDAVAGHSPGAFAATVDSSNPLELTVIEDGSAGPSTTLIAQTFDGTAGAPVEPFTLRAEGVPTSSDPFNLSLKIAPRSVAEGGGAEFSWDASAALTRIEVSRSGPAFLDGVDYVGAEVLEVPETFTTILREPGSGSALITTTVPGSTSVSGGPQINRLRLSVSSGSSALPTATGNDKLTYVVSSGTKQISLKLNGLKGMSLAADPFVLTLDNEETLTTALDLNIAVPNTSGPQLTISGILNKPSFHTKVTMTPTGQAPAKLVFSAENGSASAQRTMVSLSLNLANAGGSPTSSLSLTSVPQTFTGCIAKGDACVATAAADLPSAMATVTPTCTATQVPANVLNRPYAPEASFAFDDGGSSGTSTNISTMVTVNASITPSGESAMTVTNLRVHRVRGDVGTNSTTFTFKPVVSISAGSVPRVYFHINSQGTPFVINALSVGTFASLKLGTDANPAVANKRLVWVAGANRGSILGCSVSQNLATPAAGTLTCGGLREMVLVTVLGNINMFNLPLFGDVTNICQ